MRFVSGIAAGSDCRRKRTWQELVGATEASTSSIWNSFWFAVLAATLVCGGALLLNRKGTAARERTLSNWTAISWLLFFIPGVLNGIALIKIFNRPVLVAFYQSVGICLLALVIRYFALAWTAARHAIASVDTDLIDAARLEGASPWQMFRHAVWPQIAPQIFAAWYVVYLLCLWDVESLVVIQPPGGETLALKIFNLLHYGHAAQVNALCLTLLGLAVLPLLVAGAFIKANQLLASRDRQAVSRALASAATVVAIAVLAGCSPADPARETRLQSKLFDRALVIGSRGVGIGELNKPRSLACDTNGNVYVVDMTGRVQKFSPEGKYLSHWQMPETDLGKPKGMGRDHDGNIIVVEPHYQRVNHFTTDGKLLAQWGCHGTNEGCFMLPRGIAQNSHGDFLVSEYMGAERVQKFRVANSKSVASTATISTHATSATNWPYTPLDKPAATPSRTASDSITAHRETELLQVIGHAGTGPGEFNRAEGVCIDAQDRLYVADSCNHRIQVFASDGKFLREFGHAGTKLGELSYPYDVAVDKAGNIFVCEFGNSRIQVFDANCQPLEIIGGAGGEPGQFNNPWAITLDARGNLYVADALNHRLQKLVRHAGQIASNHTKP
ncbi:MAG: 6-bladed beta-propeller [Verrucomicrobiota bacterium]